jgi:hypothetical protein
MEGPIPFSGYKEQESNLILPEHDDDNDDDLIIFLEQAAIILLPKLRMLGSRPPFSHVYMARCSVDYRQHLVLLCPSFPDFDALTRRHQK